MSYYKPYVLANTILWKAKNDGIKDINLPKLVKIMFLTDGYYIALHDKSCLGTLFEAGEFGPTLPDIMRWAKNYGSNYIDEYITDIDPVIGDYNRVIVNKNDKDFWNLFEKIWHIYKNYNSSQLLDIVTQKDGPWDIARENNNSYIDPASTAMYFKGKISFKDKEDKEDDNLNNSLSLK